MKTVKLDIRLSPEEKEALYSRAESAGVSVSEYVRRWINEAPGIEAVHDFDSPSAGIAEVTVSDTEKRVDEAIAKAKKIESNFKPMFKDSKLNKF